MGTKKNDLEIIYNLQWKNKSGNGGDKANMIGMYDIPATTLNWEIFKSYLLKNSGTAGDDVKVSYITSNDREFPILSQMDFQIALYAFRRKARMGEIITLRLDRISGQTATTTTCKSQRSSNDVETQIDSNEAISIGSTVNSDSPPEWFMNYMTQYKKEIIDEVTASMTSVVSNIKPHTVSQPSFYHSRKSKVDCCKRRKHPLPMGEASNEKDLLKSLRLEFKLENKLEKLERKTKKIKEKKLALFTKSSDSDVGHSSSRSRSNHNRDNDDLHMDAMPVNTQTVVPHMLGGEIYLHQWEVMNSGKSPWSSKTTLHFTWGSKALQPLESVISCPYLKPGEKGSVAVRLQVPNEPGQYECYWHFHHKGRRFGHWLGCQLVVDPFDLKGNKSVLATSLSDFISTPKKIKTEEEYYLFDSLGPYSRASIAAEEAHPYTFNIEQGLQVASGSQPVARADDNFAAKNVLDDILRDVSARVDNLKIHDPNCSSDSDNQSVISLTESDSSKSSHEEFVVIPECFKVEKSSEALQNVAAGSSTNLVVAATVEVDAAVAVSEEASEKTPITPEGDDNFDDNNNTDGTNQNSSSESICKVEDELPSDSSQKSDIVLVNMPTNKEMEEKGFAYVLVDGVAVPVPKKYLKEEFLNDIVVKPSSRTGSINSSVEEKEKNDLLEAQGAVKASSKISGTNSPAEVGKEEYLKKSESVAAGSAEENAVMLPTPVPPLNWCKELEGEIPVQRTYETFMSHCSATGSCFSDVNPVMEKSTRLFIFPQGVAGYEVVNQDGNTIEAPSEEYHLAQSVVPDHPYCNNIPDTYTSSTPNLAFARYDAYGPLDEPPPLVPSAPIQPEMTATAPPHSTVHAKNPFTVASSIPHQPNYQQQSQPLPARPSTVGSSKGVFQCHENQQYGFGKVAYEIETGNRESVERPHENPAHVHILPETLMTGAVNVASSAINTARSVINMIKPREVRIATDKPGRWVNGHWVSSNPETPREANLRALAEMGFWDRDLNATLLARYNDDLNRVVAELVQ